MDEPQTVNVNEPQTLKSKPKSVSKPNVLAAATGTDLPVPVRMFTDKDNPKEQA